MQPPGLTPIMEYETKSKTTKFTGTTSSAVLGGRGGAMGGKGLVNKAVNAVSKSK